MAPVGQDSVYRFPPFWLDADAYELWRQAEGDPQPVRIPLSRQPLSVLIYLVQHQGEALKREDVFRKTRDFPAGSKYDVCEHNQLGQDLKKIRRVLGDDVQHRTYIFALKNGKIRFGRSGIEINLEEQQQTSLETEGEEGEAEGLASANSQPISDEKPFGEQYSGSPRSRISIHQRIQELEFSVTSILQTWFTRQNSADPQRQREVFKEILEPAYNELVAVHTDYLRMFQAARTSIRPTHIDLTAVESIIENLAEKRLTFEAVRVKLQALFSRLSEEELREPHAGQFVQICLEYIRPPGRGTNAFSVIRRLQASVQVAHYQEDFDLAGSVSEDIDEAIRHIRELMKQITKHYVSMKVATWRL